MKILNLGCGTKPSAKPHVINVDWSIYLRIQKNPLLRVLSRPFLRGQRRRKLHSLPRSILVHDLSKGIPFPAASIDVVYHSHFLEHLDRADAEAFLREVHRVLNDGGVHRIVVPNLERLCSDYMRSVERSDRGLQDWDDHGEYIARVIEQMVRKEAYGTAQQPPVRRFIENLVLGDAKRRGETHQWMYDRISLRSLLTATGYHSVTVQTHDTSRISDWNTYGLDVDESGAEYKPGSLYVEAVK